MVQLNNLFYNDKNTLGEVKSKVYKNSQIGG